MSAPPLSPGASAAASDAPPAPPPTTPSAPRPRVSWSVHVTSEPEGAHGESSDIHPDLVVAEHALNAVFQRMDFQLTAVDQLEAAKAMTEAELQAAEERERGGGGRAAPAGADDEEGAGQRKPPFGYLFTALPLPMILLALPRGFTERNTREPSRGRREKRCLR